MLEVAEKLKDLLNGDFSQNFKEKYYGKFLTGDITVKYNENTCTLSFHNGVVVAVRNGIPNTGVDLGIAGTTADWKQFGIRKSLSISTNKMNPHNLSLLGAPLRTRQNFNALAYLCRVFSQILEDGGVNICEKGAR